MGCTCFPNRIILTEALKKIDVGLWRNGHVPYQQNQMESTNRWHGQSVLAGPKVQIDVLGNTSITLVKKNQMIQIDIAFLSK